MGKKNYITSLDKYLYNDCRDILLHIIRVNKPMEFVKRYGINFNSYTNFIKYNYEDFNAINQGKISRYISQRILIQILEDHGYEINLQIRLKDTD